MKRAQLKQKAKEKSEALAAASPKLQTIEKKLLPTKAEGKATAKAEAGKAKTRAMEDQAETQLKKKNNEEFAPGLRVPADGGLRDHLHDSRGRGRQF